MVLLTGECPNVTVRYKQERTFFNPKFDQICPKIAKFRRINPINYLVVSFIRIYLRVIRIMLQLLLYLINTV